MSKKTVRTALTVVVSCLIMLFLFSGCDSKKDAFWDRTYLDDIRIPLETRDAEIIIREWHWLMGSGEEVYYKCDGEEILLGTLTGGDNGFCPFNEGLYAVTVDGNELIIEWPVRSNTERDSWYKEVFELPSN